MKKILVLGGTGHIGHKLWQILGQQLPDVFVTVRGSKDELRKFGSLFSGPQVIDHVDVLDRRRVLAMLDELKPSVLINAIGLTIRRPEIKIVSQSYCRNWHKKNEHDEFRIKRGLIHFKKSRQRGDTPKSNTDEKED